MEIHESLTTLDYGVVVLYIISVLSLGFWVSFRKKHTDDLFLAGRQLGWANIGLSIFGTNVSPSMMIAAFGVAYTSGMVAGNVEWLAWMFLLLLAMVFVPHYINTKISTMPEFMNRRYGPACHTFLSWYTLINTLVLWLGGTLYAGGILLGQIMHWDLWLSLLFLIVIATSFTVAGGLAAVVITDSFQSILMIGASVTLTLIAFFKIGSFQHIRDVVPDDYWNLFRSSDDSIYPWPAIVLGYPVMGIWFWCTDQTIVQRVLGGRDLKQGQLGAVFAAFLKILTPLIFFLPGIFCFVLHPNLEDQDQAYMTMVTTYLPHGMIGLVVAVLIAALVSTIDSGLNSFSTVFTLDIYCKAFNPNADAKQRIWIGRLATVAAAAVAFGCAMAMATVGKNLFDLLQGIIAFMAPPMATVFLVGVLWRRATKEAALFTLILGSIVCVGVGVCHFRQWPREDFWPHYMLLSFYLFAGLTILMVMTSLLTPKPDPANDLPTLKQTYAQLGHAAASVWVLWAILAVIMAAIYILFNLVL